MDEKKDIVPQLTEALKRDFNDAIVDNKIIADKSKKLLAGKANFNDVYDVSHEVGNTLKNAFKNNITKDILPNGKMYYNIANRAIKPKLKEAHDIISSYGADVQGLINQKEGINVKGVKAEFNEEKSENLVNKLCEYDDFDDAKWLLDENINNYCNQSVDDTIKANADFLSESGFKETISRSTNGGCCEWCEEVSGVFDYDYVKQWVLQNPDHNVFSRHRFCNCTISHNTKKGRKAVNNQWNEEKHEKERRRKLEADFYASHDGKILKKELRKYLGESKYKDLMEKYTDPEVKKYIRTAYRKTAIIGDGSTYSIRKMEKETHLNLGRNGKNHNKKVNDLIRQIEKSLKKPMQDKDKEFLENELKRLKEVKDED